jgi:hypothetical protein
MRIVLTYTCRLINRLTVTSYLILSLLPTLETMLSSEVAVLCPVDLLQ